MKSTKILLILVLLLAAGGFVWLAVTDIPVKQHPVEKTIPNDRFFE